MFSTETLLFKTVRCSVCTSVTFLICCSVQCPPQVVQMSSSPFVLHPSPSLDPCPSSFRPHNSSPPSLHLASYALLFPSLPGTGWMILFSPAVQQTKIHGYIQPRTDDWPLYSLSFSLTPRFSMPSACVCVFQDALWTAQSLRGRQPATVKATESWGMETTSLTGRCHYLDK